MNKYSKNQKGLVAIIVAILLVVLIAFLGLAVDSGFMFMKRNQLQNVADAAALSCVINNKAPTAGCGDGVTQQTNITVTTNDYIKTVNPNAYKVVATYPFTPCPRNGVGCAKAVVTIVYKPFFMGVLGFSSIPIGATAVAGKLMPPACLVGLNPASGHNSIVVSGNGSLTASNCSIESNANISRQGNGDITAGAISAAGNYSNTGSAGTVSPAPLTNQPTVSDPLSSLVSAPSFTNPTAGCSSGTSPAGVPYSSSTGYSLGNNKTDTLPAGTYCKGISIGNNSTLNLSGGTYVIYGGGISINNGATLQATSVASAHQLAIYNTGNSTTYPYGAINDSGAIKNMEALTTGNMKNVLFYQDPNNTQPATFNGITGTDVIGAFYFPKAVLNVSSNGNATVNSLVAYEIVITGGGALKVIPNTSGSVASPIHLLQ